MTIYERIKEFSLEEMADFLLVFAKESIEQFGNFILPTKEMIIEFLNRKQNS